MKEILRMQMMAGIITESEYKNLLEDMSVINKILDKISAQGEKSLTPEEKNYLDQYSKGEKNLIDPYSKGEKNLTNLSMDNWQKVLTSLTSPEDRAKDELNQKEEKSLLNSLNKYVDGYDIYKNNYNTWELALFYTYNEWLDAFKPRDFELEKVSLSPEEWDDLHNKLQGNYEFNYFVRNFTTKDFEETRHEDEIGKDIQHFINTYKVDIKIASIMKKLVDNHIHPDGNLDL
jgi:hypothetical protein